MEKSSRQIEVEKRWLNFPLNFLNYDPWFDPRPGRHSSCNFPVEDTPIPKFITERREAIYEKAPLFRFGFADKCTSINRLFRTEVTAISYSKASLFIEPVSSDLMKNAWPFIMNPVSSGWRFPPASVLEARLNVNFQFPVRIRQESHWHVSHWALTLFLRLEKYLWQSHLILPVLSVRWIVIVNARVSE